MTYFMEHYPYLYGYIFLGLVLGLMVMTDMLEEGDDLKSVLPFNTADPKKMAWGLIIVSLVWLPAILWAIVYEHNNKE